MPPLPKPYPPFSGRIKMMGILRSFLTAALLAGAILGFTLFAVTPSLPRLVGRPDFVFERSLQFDNASRLRIENADGHVRVFTHSENSLTVQAAIRVYLMDELPDLSIPDYAQTLLVAQQESNVIRLVTEPGTRPDGLYLSVDYLITAPIGIALDVDCGHGNVWVSKGCGEVSVRGLNTDIEVVQPQGAVHAETTNGRIRVTDAPADASLRTVNGTIYAHQSGGMLDASTINGGIVAHILSGEVSACRLTCKNGGVTVIFHADASATVNATTAQGVIRSDVLMESENALNTRQKVRGWFGNGWTVLTVDSLNGDIRLVRSAV